MTQSDAGRSGTLVIGGENEPPASEDPLPDAEPTSRAIACVMA